MGTECASLDLVLLVWGWEEDSGLVRMEGSSPYLVLVGLLLGPCWRHVWVRMKSPYAAWWEAKMLFLLPYSPGWESAGLPLGLLILSRKESIYLTHLLLRGGPKRCQHCDTFLYHVGRAPLCVSSSPGVPSQSAFFLLLGLPATLFPGGFSYA